MTAAELLAGRRPLSSLQDLDGTDDVLVEHVATGAPCHLVTADRRAARCGALMADRDEPLTVESGWRLGVHQMRAMFGRLCVACADRWSQ